MFTWIWIEGYKALEEFCEKRFQEQPKFNGMFGKVGPAKVQLRYKEVYDENGEWVRNAQMFLLWMKAPEGMTRGNIAEWGDLNYKIKLMTYEEIRADRYALIKR